MADEYYSSDEEDSSSCDESIISSTSSSTDLPLTVYVGRLPPFVTDGHLRNHFTNVSDSIIKINVIRDKETKISKGFAFIQFVSEDVADRAVITYNRSRIFNKHPIDVRKKNVKKNHSQQQHHGGRRKRKSSQGNYQIVKVWVGNLSATTTKDDLIVHFGAFKQQMVKPIQNIGKGKNDTFFTFLSFSSLGDANDVVSRMNGTTLNGKKLRIQPSRTTPPVTPLSPSVAPCSSSSTRSERIKRGSTSESSGITSNCTIILTNVAPQIGEVELRDLVDHFSPVSVQINADLMTASITFQDHHVANRAIKELNGQTFLGKCMSAAHTIPVIIPQETSYSIIKVSHLHDAVTIEDLKTVFSSVGSITDCFISQPKKKSDTSFSRITFQGTSTASRAVTRYNGYYLHGQRINVSIHEHSTCVVISNLSPTTSGADVFHCFKAYGKINGRVDIVDNILRSARVTFVSFESAQRAVKELNGTSYKGSKINVFIDSQQTPLTSDLGLCPNVEPPITLLPSPPRFVLCAVCF